MSPVHHTSGDHTPGCALVALALAFVATVGALCLWGIVAFVQARGGAL